MDLSFANPVNTTYSAAPIQINIHVWRETQSIVSKPMIKLQGS